MANLKDIAQKLGVSVSTVSRGLNGGKEISREMTEKILKAADELGYTPAGPRRPRHAGLEFGGHHRPRGRVGILRASGAQGEGIFSPRRAIRSS